MFRLLTYAALFLALIPGGQATESSTERAARLNKEAANLTMMSPDARVFTSLIEGDLPVLRVDNKNANAKWVNSSQQDSEWGMELYSMGFKRYLITNKEQYWLLEPDEKGFRSQILGPFPYANLPPSENALVESNSRTAVAAKAQFKQDMKDLRTASATKTGDQSKEEKFIKPAPPRGATVYEGLYVGEPLRAINTKETHCFNEIANALDALIQDRPNHTCLMISEDGHSLSRFVEFTTTPLSHVQESLTALFGNPAPGKVRLLDTDGPPEWKSWRMKDGTYILMKSNTVQNRHTGRIVDISEIVVMKRWQEQSAP